MVASFARLFVALKSCFDDQLPRHSGHVKYPFRLLLAHSSRMRALGFHGRPELLVERCFHGRPQSHPSSRIRLKLCTKLSSLSVCSHFSCSQRARGALHVGLKVRWPSHENARVMRSCSRDRGACTCRSDVSRGVCHCLRGGRRVGPFGTADPPCRSDGTPDPLPSSRTRSSTGFGRWRTQSGRSTDRRACQL